MEMTLSSYECVMRRLISSKIYSARMRTKSRFADLRLDDKIESENKRCCAKNNNIGSGARPLSARALLICCLKEAVLQHPRWPFAYDLP